ncbi:unnamed protein product [Larinioides sclopetarius]|uniref:Uncharacterized protein n=1 Tax=Larinioides sclopetarius TaxID=280406 RepID=A0AAV1ZSS8_9ARAC
MHPKRLKCAIQLFQIYLIRQNSLHYHALNSLHCCYQVLNILL